MVSLKEKIRDYWDAVPCGTGGIKHPEGIKEYYGAIASYRYRVEPFIHDFAEFERWNGKRVLEVGCGVGSDLLEFAKGGARVVGIDLSRHSAFLARRRLLVYGLGGDVFESDAECLPFKDGSFDMVYCWGVLHHTPDAQKGIEEIYRVVKPDGNIRVMLYNKRSLVSLQAYLLFGLLSLKPFRGIDDILASHMESEGTRAYTIEEVKRMFASFKEVSVKSVVTLYDIRYRRRNFLPQFLMRLIPKKFGWYIFVKAMK